VQTQFIFEENQQVHLMRLFLFEVKGPGLVEDVQLSEFSLVLFGLLSPVD
jgi:hypothetical protein